MNLRELVWVGVGVSYVSWCELCELDEVVWVELAWVGMGVSFCEMV